MSGASKNRDVARAWLSALNAHDTERIVDLYASDAVHTSPKLRVQKPETGGQIKGRAALSTWFREAFERIPSLRYQEVSITANEVRAIIEYVRHAEGDPPLPVAEVFDMRGGVIVSSRVYHG